MTLVVAIAAIMSVIAMAAWIGLMIWAAIGDGRTQREHEESTPGDDRAAR